MFEKKIFFFFKKSYSFDSADWNISQNECKYTSSTQTSSVEWFFSALFRGWVVFWHLSAGFLFTFFFMVKWMVYIMMNYTIVWCYLNKNRYYHWKWLKNSYCISCFEWQKCSKCWLCQEVDFELVIASFSLFFLLFMSKWGK